MRFGPFNTARLSMGELLTICAVCNPRVRSSRMQVEGADRAMVASISDSTTTSEKIDEACKAFPDACKTCYETLRHDGNLRVFGAWYHLPSSPSGTMSPAEFADATSLPTTAFAPKPRESRGLQMAPIESAAGLVVAQLVFASGALLDDLPLRSLAGLRQLAPWQLPTLVLSVLLSGATVLFLLDKLLLQERLLGLVQLAVPRRRECVLRHEAGHFLCAYCLGLPVQACELNPLRTLADRAFEARAGTRFLSPAIEALLEERDADEADVRRASIVLMGGIAAEALWAGHAEGGAADEAALRALLEAHVEARIKARVETQDEAQREAPREAQREAQREVQEDHLEDAFATASYSAQPPNEQTVRSRARWAVASAVALLRERSQEYEALCAALEDGASVGQCVIAIETAQAAS